LLSSKISLENFYDTRKELIAEKFTNEALIKEMINKSISKIFEEKLTHKFEKFKENCQLTHYQSRKDFFLNMKHLVFNQNFLYNQLDDQKIREIAKNLSIPLFFPEKDTESFLDVPNPEFSPKNFPPARLAQFITKTVVDDVKQYKVAKKEEINKYFKENQEIFQKKMDEKDLYFKPTEESIRFREKNLEFMRRYNMGKKETLFRENYIQETLGSALKLYKIHDFVFSKMNTDYNEILFGDRKMKYQDIANEFLAEMRLKEHVTNQLPCADEELKEMKIKIEAMKEIKKDFKQDSGQRVDLQLEGDLRFNKFKNYNEKNLMEQVMNFIESDKEFSRLFEPLVTRLNGKYSESLRDKYLKLFLKIYEKHIGEILIKEHNELRSAAPVLTKDGKNSILTEKTDEFMEIFDDFIHRSISLDFHKLIMQDVLYIFSYFCLIELEKRVAFISRIASQIERTLKPPALNDMIPNYTRRFQMYENDTVKMFKNFSLPFDKFEDISELVNFMNNICENMGGIYSITRQQIKFPNTRLYKNYQEKINENFREHEDFMEKLAGNYEFKTDMENRLKKLELEKKEKRFSSNNNFEFNLSAFDLQSFANKEKRNFAYDVISDEISLTDRKTLSIGVLDYFKKLEGLTACGIHGKSNVFNNYFLLIWIKFLIIS